MVSIDLHVHSAASFDSQSDPAQVAVTCARLGLHPIVLTDHNSISGALELEKLGVGRVVIGEEVMTTQGELIGLFLAQLVPPGLSAKETADEIKGQRGLVYLEHPYDAFRRHLTEEAIEEIADLIDIVEVLNGRSDGQANQRAQDLCETLGAAPAAGSDAHTLREIGSVYVEMEGFDGAQDFLRKLGRSAIVKRRSRLMQIARSRLGPRMGGK